MDTVVLKSPKLCIHIDCCYSSNTEHEPDSFPQGHTVSIYSYCLTLYAIFHYLLPKFYFTLVSVNIMDNFSCQLTDKTEPYHSLLPPVVKIWRRGMPQLALKWSQWRRRRASSVERGVPQMGRPLWLPLLPTFLWFCLPFLFFLSVSFLSAFISIINSLPLIYFFGDSVAC